MHQTDLFYCAHDIGAVVCPFIYHYATHTANVFRAVRHLWNHCAAERTCRFVSRWLGAYFIPIRSMFGRVGCIAHVILLLNACIRVADVMRFTFVSLMPVHNVCRICKIIKE